MLSGNKFDDVSGVVIGKALGNHTRCKVKQANKSAELDSLLLSTLLSTFNDKKTRLPLNVRFDKTLSMSRSE